MSYSSSHVYSYTSMNYSSSHVYSCTSVSYSSSHVYSCTTASYSSSHVYSYTSVSYSSSHVYSCELLLVTCVRVYFYELHLFTRTLVYFSELLLFTRIEVKWSSSGRTELAIHLQQVGLQLMNVLVTLILSHRSFNYDTDHGRVWITLGDWHCGLKTFMLGSRSEPMQSSITACSTGQSANHLHHRGDENTTVSMKARSLNPRCLQLALMWTFFFSKGTSSSSN